MSSAKYFLSEKNESISWTYDRLLSNASIEKKDLSLLGLATGLLCLIKNSRPIVRHQYQVSAAQIIKAANSNHRAHFQSLEMMKFNFDSKLLALQIPSGILLGLLSILISRFLHIPLLPTKLQVLVCIILFLDVLHLLGKINIDISNLCKREKFLRKIDNEKPSKILQIYLEEHFVFLLCFFASLFLTRFIVHFLHK